jgi:hypothetical protein
MPPLFVAMPQSRPETSSSVLLQRSESLTVFSWTEVINEERGHALLPYL